ncbi:MAG: ParA family protein [Gammaproteobacteria bacterium]|nr:ParA family protein [Gammaproteobacteria bacterium]
MNKPIIIAVLSEKGGSGKTNTSINLARYLMIASYRVVLIDNDPQGSSTYWRSRCADPDNSPTVMSINYPITANEIRLAENSDFVVIDGSPGLEADNRLREMAIFMRQLARHDDMPEALAETIHDKLVELLGPGNQVVARNAAAIRIADYVIVPASVADQDTKIAEAMIRDLVDSDKQRKSMVLLNQARQDNTRNEIAYRKRFEAQDITVLETTVLNRQAYDNCYRNGTTVLDDKTDIKATHETERAMAEIMSIVGAEK